MAAFYLKYAMYIFEVQYCFFLILWNFHTVYFKHIFLLPQSFPRSSPIPTHPNSWPFSLLKKNEGEKPLQNMETNLCWPSTPELLDLPWGVYTSWLRSGVGIKFNIITFGWAQPNCYNILDCIIPGEENHTKVVDHWYDRSHALSSHLNPLVRLRVCILTPRY